jgi:hypothetical protein
MPAGRAVAAFTTLRSRQSIDFPENRYFYLLNHKLRYPVTFEEPDRVLGIGVQQNYLDLATVPGVHGARRIDDRDPVTRRQARTRMHEGGIPGWQRNAHSGPDNYSLTRLQINVGGREQVAARIARMRPGRQRQIRVKPPDEDLDLSGLTQRARQ